jgi:GT2 family glycosyltransferase
VDLSPGSYRVRYEVQGRPLVSIILLTRDKTDVVLRCLESIEEKTAYENYELLIVHHHVGENADSAHAALGDRRIIDYTGAFDFVAMNKAGAAVARGEYLVLLNDDTEVITPEWLEAMLEHAQRREVGAVGARLYYPDGSVQHEGTVIGLLGGPSGNVDHGGYFGLGELVLDCSAVTAACMMTRREVWDELGGLEPKLAVVFNDVDFCLRARAKGYQVVYTPFARLYHYEGATRGKLYPWDEELFFRQRWGNPGQLRDPFYNPNLSRSRAFHIDPAA